MAYNNSFQQGTPRTSEQNRLLLEQERRAGFACTLRETIGNRMKHEAEQVLDRIARASKRISEMKKYNRSYINDAISAEKSRKKTLHIVSTIHSMESI